MAWWKREQKPTSAEVQAAMEERDELIDGVQAAVAKVDHLQDEMMSQYKAANGVHRRDDDGVH